MKLVWMRDRGKHEIAAMGVSSPTDPMLVEDIKVLPQQCSQAFVRFDDIPYSDYMLDCVDAGIPIDRVLRIWIHTHPGDSATPSGTDWETFREKFGRYPWAVMFILAKGGNVSCRFRTTQCGFSMEKDLKVQVDYTYPDDGILLPPASELEAIYSACCRPSPTTIVSRPTTSDDIRSVMEWRGKKGRKWWQEEPNTEVATVVTSPAHRSSGGGIRSYTPSELAEFRRESEDSCNIRRIKRADDIGVRIVRTLLSDGDDTPGLVTEQEAAEIWDASSSDEKLVLIRQYRERIGLPATSQEKS